MTSWIQHAKDILSKDPDDLTARLQEVEVVRDTILKEKANVVVATKEIKSQTPLLRRPNWSKKMQKLKATWMLM